MNNENAAIALPLLVGAGVGVATANPMAGMAAASATGAVVGGIQANQAAGEEQEQIKNQAELERVSSEQQANEIRRQMASTLGTQTSMLASRGVALGAGGVAEQLGAEATGRFQADLRTNRLNALTGQQALSFQSRQAGKAGKAALAKGLLEGGMAVYSGYKDYKATGSTTTLPGNSGNATRGPLISRSSAGKRGE